MTTWFISLLIAFGLNGAPIIETGNQDEQTSFHKQEKIIVEDFTVR